MNAKYIRKYNAGIFDKNGYFLEYEYKGKTYTIYKNASKGNEPAEWQHKTEQNRIDKIIAVEKTSQGEPTSNEEIIKTLYKLFED